MSHTRLRVPVPAVTKRLWMEWKKEPQSSKYLLPYVFRLHPGTDPRRLEEALRATIDAHEALRCYVDDEHFVVGATPERVLQTSPPGDWEWAVTEPLDLNHPPLWRFVLAGDLFVVNVSHVILDGTGIEMLLDEVARRYAGETVEPGDDRLEAWAAHEAGYHDEEDRQYWLELLGATDFHMALPTRRSTYRGEPDGIHHFSLPKPELAMSPFQSLTAILMALLYRYTEQENISVLYPTNMRGPEFASCFGSFVNTLPATAQFSRELTFRQLCEQVRTQRRTTAKHAGLPFQDLIRALRQDRQVASLELPNVTIALSAFHPRFALGENVAIRSVDHQNELLFMLNVLEDRVDVRVHYQSSLFERTCVEELCGHFAMLAAAVQAHPDTPLSTLALGEPPPAAPTHAYREVLLHEAVAEQAERSPDAPALLTKDRTFTYREMQSLANRIAHALREKGAKPNTLVAVLMEKGWEQTVACLGIQQSGAAYLPINAAWPAERIDAVLEQGEVQFVLSQEPVLKRLGREGMAVDGPWSDYPDTRLPSVNSLDDICYVIFTSGSTGRPKGVVLSHRGVMNTVLDCNARYQVTERDRCLQLSDLSFDLSVYDIFGLLSAGGAVVIPDEDRHLEPPHWIDLVRQHGVTLWNSVPMFVDMWVASSVPLPSVRLFMLSGDKIPVDLPDRVRALQPDSAMWSLGGATEGSIWSIWYEIGEVDPAWSSIPYGHAMTNQEMYVLDAGLNHCPVYMPGRIFIGGKGVALGYWRDPAKTDAAFLTHNGARIYNTGDLGRWLPDGNIEFLGRADFQVKINGFRVELGEIEGALLSLPQVKSAVVDTLEYKGKCLVAYVVLSAPIPPEGLREALQQRLPYYMVPRFFVQLDALPLSGNGKLDRKALPKPDVEHMLADQPFVAPRTPLEGQLAELWKVVLKHEPIGVHDNFFTLGGDSLLTMQLVMKAREAGLAFTAQTLQAAPTIAELAGKVGKTSDTAVGKAEGELPLTPMQAYYLGWARTNPSQFNVSAVFRCELEQDRLERALQDLVAHHDSLRLRFSHGVQSYREEAPVPLERVTARLDELPARIVELQGRLDIENGPVMRATLYDTEEGQRLVLICHHLVCDGVAWGFLLDDLQKAYAGQPLPAPSGTFKAWSEHLVRYAKSPRAQGHLPYWRAQDAPSLPVEEAPREALQSDYGVHEVELAPAGPHLYERTAAALRAASGQERLLIHLVGHGRESLFDDIDPTRICGWFTTHTPVVLEGGLDEVTATLHGLPDHGLSHGALRRYDAACKDLARYDQVKVLYNFLGDTWDTLFGGPLLHRPEEALLWPPGHCDPANPADFWLYLHCYVYQGVLKGRLVYSRLHHTPEMVQGLAERMQACLR